MAYGYKRTITCGNASGGTQSNFPLLLKFDSSNSGTTLKTVGNGGRIQNTVTQSGGNAVTMPADLIFTSDSAGTTKIPWEIDFYDGTNGVLWVWVQIASLTTSGATIYAFYGDTSVSTQQNTSTVSPANVWDTSYAGVWHLPDGSTLNLKDSTSNANDLTNNNTATAGTGQVDGGVGLASASNQYLTKADNASLTPTAITVSAWVKATSFPNAYNAIVHKQSTGYYEYFVNSAGKLSVFLFGSASYDGTGSHTLSTGTWYLVSFTYDNATGLIGYVNGASDATAASFGTISQSGGNFEIGADNTAGGRQFNGVIDEVQVSNVARSANWLLTQYNNQNAPLTFNTIGSEVSLGATLGNQLSQYLPILAQ